MKHFSLALITLVVGGSAFAGTHYSVVCDEPAKLAEKIGPKVVFSTEKKDILQRKGMFYSSPFVKDATDKNEPIAQLCVVTATTGLVWGIARDFKDAKDLNAEDKAAAEKKALEEANKTAFQYGLK